MMHKIIGVLMIVAAVWIYFNFGISKAEARKSLKAWLISLIVIIISMFFLYCGVEIFNGNYSNLF